MKTNQSNKEMYAVENSITGFVYKYFDTEKEAINHFNKISFMCEVLNLNIRKV